MSDLKVDGVIASTGTNTNLTLQGKGSGKVAIGDGALLFPDADGSANQVIETNASGVLSFVTPSAGGFTLGTEQATTSGTSKTFGSIPSGVSLIIINLTAVSFTSGNQVDVVLGDSGGLETSGYVSMSVDTAGTAFTSTSAFIFATDSGSHVADGHMFLTLENSSTNYWVQTHMARISNGYSVTGGGTKALSGVLTQIQISGGTFDAGAINIMYQ